MKAPFAPLMVAGLAAALTATPAAASSTQSTSLQSAAAAQVGDVAPDSPLVWVPAASAPVGIVRYAQAQCIGQNVFYVISGVAAGGSITTANQRYNATTNTWTPLAPIPSGSEGPAGVCYQGKIYVAGGGSANFFIYDITANTWAAGPAMPFATAMAHMGANNGKVYVAGGDADFNPSTGVLNTVAVYDIATNAWVANGANMPTATSAGGYAQIGTFLYVVGGWGTTAPTTNVNQTQRYDMATNTWSAGPTFTTARSDFALAASGVALYAIGGDNNGGGFFDLSTTVERLAVSTWPAGTWTATDSLPSARSAHRGGFCTNAFLPASGEVWSTAGIAAPFPTFTGTNQYLQAEACPSVAVATAVPAALEVDPAPANRVIEPNEAAVVVAPSWRNNSTVAIASLTGTANTFTGPAGATYTINDATASYGALAPSAVVSCLSTGDCYRVTVAAATRPVTHWDATFTETVAPLGTSKAWTIHIGGSFTDVPTTNPFYRFIETILHKNVTGGCTTTAFCPSAATTREQMAVFVLVAKQGAGYVPPACTGTRLFADVPASSSFCPYIEELSRRGVVSGCSATNYCPAAPTTREQMAVFVLRTLDPTLNPPACGTPVFGDVPASSPFCKWIEELVRRNVVTGCGGGNYCPTAAVTREQMSVFLTVTFGLVLYGV